MNERAKPIEAGCLALLVNIPKENHYAIKYLNHRDVVLVIEPAIDHIRSDGKWWTIDVAVTGYDKKFAAINESHLMRIDDELQKQIESEKALENA